MVGCSFIEDTGDAEEQPGPLSKQNFDTRKRGLFIPLSHLSSVQLLTYITLKTL
jgi:hypothetical protein